MHKHIGAFGRFSIGSFGAWMVLFALIPFGLVIVASFLSKGEEQFITFPLTFANYARILDPTYGAIFLSSLKLSFYTTAMTLLLSLPFAYALSTLKAPYKSLALL